MASPRSKHQQIVNIDFESAIIVNIARRNARYEPTFRTPKTQGPKTEAQNSRGRKKATTPLESNATFTLCQLFANLMVPFPRTLPRSVQNHVFLRVFSVF